MFLILLRHNLTLCGLCFYSLLQSCSGISHSSVSQWLHLWTQPTFPTDRSNVLVPVNHSSSLHTDSTCSFSSRGELSMFSDMFFKIAFLFLILVFWGPVHGGPQTNLHPNITDQELFWGSDQYDFSVVLPAAGLECFWHFAHRGERFYLHFMVRREAEASTRFPQFVFLLCLPSFKLQKIRFQIWSISV